MVLSIVILLSIVSITHSAFRKTVRNVNIEGSGTGTGRLVGDLMVYDKVRLNLIVKTPVTKTGYAYMEFTTFPDFSKSILMYVETGTDSYIVRNDLYWNMTLAHLEYIEPLRILLGVTIDMPNDCNTSTLIYGHYALGLGRFSQTTYSRNAVQMVNLNVSFLDALTPFIGNQRGYNVATPMRYEYLHPALYASTCLMYITALILCFMFRNYQPMKSRGITGSIICCFMLLDLNMSMIPKWILTLQQNQNFKCYYHFFTHTSVHITLMMVCLLHYLRYVILAYLNDRKTQIFQNNLQTTSRKIPRSIIFLKIFGYWWFQLILTIGIYIALGIWYICWLIPTECEVPPGWSIDVGGIATFTLIAMTGLMFMVILALDILSLGIFFAKTRSLGKLWNRIWSQDHLWWRFEFIFIGVLILLPAMISNILIYIFHPTQLAMLVTNSINFHAMWFFGCGFSLLITMWNFARSCCTKSKFTRDTSKNKIKDALMDKFVLKMFETFALSEFSVENIYFFKDYMEYKREPQKEKGLQIFNRYLNGRSSELELNIPGPIVESVKDRVLLGEYFDALFDEIMTVVYSNLTDTYTRFVLTRDYKYYVRMSAALEHGIRLDDATNPYSLMVDT
jgi:hypothetical protein